MLPPGRARLLLLCLVAAGAATSSCESRSEAPAGGGAPLPREKEAAASRAAAALRGTSAYVVAPVPNPGSLEATAFFSGGPIPEPAEVPASAGIAPCAHQVFTDSLLVDRETRGLRNVVLRLHDIHRGKEPAAAVAITIKRCAFEPHVATAVRGAKLEVQSADPLLHVTQASMNGVQLFSFEVTAAAPAARVLPQVGLLELTCSVHSFMRGYIAVHSNPYLAATDERGKLRIDGIPPGKHRFTAWHEELGEQQGEAEIAPGGKAELKLEFAAPR